MNWHEAEKLARTLMDRHGLTARGWRFAWSRGKRELGACQIATRRNRVTGESETVRTIKLSRYLVAMNNDEEVRDTILHEIAHAIAGLEHGHDAHWQDVCRRIGAQPKRTAGEEVNAVEPPYVITCSICRQVLQRRYKRIRAERLKQLYCGHCGPASNGKLRFAAARAIGPPSLFH